MLTRPLCAYAHVPQCAHLYVYCMFVCQWVSMRPHRSQLQSTVKVNFYLILTLFSGLSTGSLTSPLDMDRHSQVALSDCYHCLPTLPTHTPSLPCQSPPNPIFFSPCLQHLAELSRGLVSGSALQASPLLVILHQP